MMRIGTRNMVALAGAFALPATGAGAQNRAQGQRTAQASQAGCHRGIGAAPCQAANDAAAGLSDYEWEPDSILATIPGPMRA